jgi:ribosomal protein S1
VGLSLKRVQPDPWSHVEEDYKSGELVEAVVTRVTDFGAFVRLRSGVEGLLHVTEMADIRPDHPQSLVNPGDLLLLRVIRIESQRRRIGLSLRQVSESEWASWAASYREKFTPEAEEGPEAEAMETEAEAEETVAIASAEAAAEETVGELVAEEIEAEAAEAVAVAAALAWAEEAVIEEALDEAVATAGEEAAIEEAVDEAVAMAVEEAVIEETLIESQVDTTEAETMSGEAAVDDEAYEALAPVNDEPGSLVLVEEAPDSEEEVAQPAAPEDTFPEAAGDEKNDEMDSDGDDEKE